jgi:hypothetical protein
MSGAGLQKAGSTSAGFGTSAAATEPEGAFLRDTRTGKSLGARKIDPNTRDYMLDDNGRVLGLDYVKHAVQMSLHTDHGSSVDTRMGQKLRSLDRITPNFERRVLAVLTEALQPLISLGYVEVLGFTAFTVGTNRNGLQRGAVYGRLRWRDLTTKQEHTELL